MFFRVKIENCRFNFIWRLGQCKELELPNSLRYFIFDSSDFMFTPPLPILSLLITLWDANLNALNSSSAKLKCYSIVLLTAASFTSKVSSLPVVPWSISLQNHLGYSSPLLTTWNCSILSFLCSCAITGLRELTWKMYQPWVSQL